MTVELDSVPVVGYQPGIQAVPLEHIRREESLQVRFDMSLERVEDFRAAMADGAAFPPIIVYWDDTDLWLSDGFHRTTAAILSGHATIPADVRLGTRRDALAFAYFANATHGEPLTPRERRAALRRIVAAFPDASTRELAGRLGVHQSTIVRARDFLAAGDAFASPIAPARDTLPLPGSEPSDDAEPPPSSPYLVQFQAAQDERQDTVGAVLAVTGDDDGSWERAKRLAYYSQRAKVASELVLLDPEALADLLSASRQESATALCEALIGWCSRFQTAMARPLHAVPIGAEEIQDG